MEANLVGRWESRGGKYWIELHKDQYGFSYRGRDCGGFIGNVSESLALANIENRLDMFQADANKTPMRRVQ